MGKWENALGNTWPKLKKNDPILRIFINKRYRWASVTCEGGPPTSSAVSSSSSSTSSQGLTLVHFSAQRKHILLDTSGT